MNRVAPILVCFLCLLAVGCATRPMQPVVTQEMMSAQEPVLALAPAQEAVMNEKPEELEVIEVEILGPIWHGWPRGRDWLTKKEDEPRIQIYYTDPHEMVIRLPGGRVIRHYSRATRFIQEGGHIIDVSLRPHDGTLPYQETIRLLESILEQWDAELREHSKPDMERWKARGDWSMRGMALPLPADQGGADLRGEEKAGIVFRIHMLLPGRQSPDDPGGWYLTVNVSVGWQEVRKILEGPDAREPNVH